MPTYVVTGANRGLGYAFVKHLAATKANMVIALVREPATAARRAAADGIDTIHFLEAHITDAASMTQAATATAALTDGAIDVLIHNAAYVSEQSGFSTLVDIPPVALEADLLESFRVNVVGAAHTIAAFLPLVRRGAHKKVIVVSTGMADPDFVTQFDIPIAAPYAVSKAAVNLLVAKYHAALGKSEGILFLALSPGLVQTAERAPTAAELEGARAMGAMFANYAPHFTGPIAPAESVVKQLEVIERASVESMGGQFVSHFGNKQWL